MGTAAPAQRSSLFSLALPTASAGPDPLAHQGLYNGSANSASASGGAAESDDEWDEILAQPDRGAPYTSSSSSSSSQQGQQQQLTITMEDEEEGDDGLDFLERELLGEDEPMGDGDGDEEEEDLEEEIIGHGSHVSAGGAGAAGPMSMNQFAGGDVPVDDDDDDYSSSEESEED